jgi:hypothetical protein
VKKNISIISKKVRAGISYISTPAKLDHVYRVVCESTGSRKKTAI